MTSCLLPVDVAWPDPVVLRLGGILLLPPPLGDTGQCLVVSPKEWGDASGIKEARMLLINIFSIHRTAP